MTNFEDLDDDVLFLILQYLKLERLSTLYLFRLVSHRLKYFAESCLYNTLVLEDAPLHEDASYRLIERLLDSSDTLSQHVRDMHIKSFKGDNDSCCFNTTLLLAALRSFQKLNYFRWDCDIPLPDELLHILHQLYPSARLCASVKTLNQALLSSPQLYSLTISVPCANTFHPETEIRLGELKHVLVRCHSLRVLILNVHRDHSLWKLQEDAVSQSQITTRSERPDWMSLLDETMAKATVNKIQIPLESKDILPSLEYLAIDAKTYLFDREHCVRLLECMDTKSLKRLRIGSSNSETFFEIFKDKLPQLEILEFDFHCTQQSYLLPFHANSGACSEFIASIIKLEEVVVCCNIINPHETFWGALSETHGSHLRRLSIQSRNKGLEAPFSEPNLINLLSRFPNLRSLELAMNQGDNSCCKDCSVLGWHVQNTNYIAKIPFLKLMRTIEISIQFNFSERGSFYSYIVEHAHCAIVKLWSFYTKVGEDFDLEMVSIRVWRWEPPSPHPDENGNHHTTRINEMIFDSKVKNDKLIVTVRNRNDISTRSYSRV